MLSNNYAMAILGFIGLILPFSTSLVTLQEPFVSTHVELSSSTQIVLNIPSTIGPIDGLVFQYINTEALPPLPLSTSYPKLIPSIKLTVTPTPILIPTPTATPTLPNPDHQTIDQWFQEYAQEFGVDIHLLRKIAVCESGYRIEATNGEYGGMFQFHRNTWISTRNQMGLDSNPDLRFNAQEAIRTAAWKISREGARAWPNCQ